MSDSLFEDKPVETTEPVVSSSVQTTALESTLVDQLMQIKNERGEPKYDSIPKALEALSHSQEYIPQLKGQVSEYEKQIEALKNELAKRESVEDVIARLTPRQPEEPVHTSQPKGLDEASVEEILQRTLTKREAEAVYQRNTQSVSDALISKFGDKAQEVVGLKAKELGLSTKDLGELSAKSPAAVLALFNTSLQSSTTSAPVRSTVHLPDSQKPQDLSPKTSMLRGAKQSDIIDYWNKIKADVYNKNGIDS